MRLQHYNAATRGGTGNAGTAGIQAQCERGRRRKPRSGLDCRFRSGPHFLFRGVWRCSSPRRRGSRSAPPGCAWRRRYNLHTSRLSTSGPGCPRRRAGPADRRAPGTRATGPSPSPASRHPPPRRAVRGAPSSLRSPTSACLLLSTDVSRSTVAVPRNEKPYRQRSRAHIGRKRHGKCRPFRLMLRRRDSGTPPSQPRRRRQPPREPSNRRRAASHARRVSAPTPDSMPHASAPPTWNPPRRSLDAQGRTPAGGLQGPRHFFRFFAPCAPRANNAKN